MKFTRDLSHVLRLFRPIEEPRQPDELQDQVVAAIDLLGWTRWQDIGNVVQDSTAAANTVSWNAPALESGELYFIPYVELTHNDGAASHTLWLAIFDGGLEIAVRQPVTVSTGLPVNLIDPPLILTNRYGLRGRSGDTLPAGSSLFLRHARIVIPPGEYLLR